MGVPMAMETLTERAAFMRESLQKSQAITDSIVTILGSFDHRLSALDAAMRPTQVRTHSIRKAHENIDKTLKAAEVILAQFDVSRQAESKILKGPHDDLESYLEAVEQLRSNVRFFSSNKSFKSSDAVLNHANGLLAKAILKLEEEFRQRLSSYSKPLEPDRLFESLPNNMRPSSGSPGHHGDSNGRNPTSTNHSELQGKNLENTAYNPPTLIPPRIIPLLHDLVQQMVQAGHQQQCLKIYREMRASALEQSLRKLGVEKLSKDDVQKMQWEVLEAKIGNWIHFMRIAIESVFKGKACTEMRESALSLTKRLAQTAQETFGDFEEAVEKDATKTAVLDGTVHPLTSYVINYVKFLFDYQSTLKQLFQEFENGEESNSQLAVVTMRIMQALQTNLDGKSKQYKDPALTQLFLMNNIHYMVRSVRRSEAKDLLGDDWVQRHRRIVQQHANQYKRVSWGKILQCLSFQGLTSSSGGSAMGTDGGNSSGVSRAMVKDRFKTFNMQYEELHQRQSQWTVPDPELRESLRLAVAEVLLPAYRSFVKRFGPLIENGKNPQKYNKYSADDLDRMLGEFFEGKTWNEPKR
ncbi:exocyst complex component EXO70A1-like isoform X2 [Magnolia sinica]|uniref:exocyst complex component EXO70A1-like isoform X2 n=1 Tax=Magnolia sinica TaxID=86752 RepID=UPI002658A859|nr:exocyst complex component EXO70A1-like isoform X2 [Magnolia sinica]